MGKKSKSGTEKKKKGPKGKRARAKAKLERQWGEEANEEIGSFKRAGKSRLLSSSSRKLDTPIVENEIDKDGDELETAMLLKSKQGDGSDSDSDDENEPESMDLENGGAFAKLLQTIRKDGDGGSEEDSDLEQDMEVSKNLIPDESDDESDDEANDDAAMVQDFDPFGSRFSKDPLPEDDSKRDQLLQKLTQLQKSTCPSCGSPVGTASVKPSCRGNECKL